MTQHERELEQLAEAVRLGARAAAAPGDVVVVTDPGFRVISWDEAATELYGWTEAEAMGRLLTELVPWAGTVSDMRAGQQQLARHGLWQGRARQKRRDGSVVVVDCVVRVVTGSTGEPIAIIGVNKPVGGDDDEDDALLAEIAGGLAAGHFEAWYQPIVRPGDASIVKVEALVRWRHPEHGILPPIAFLPALERSALIAGLDEHVLRTACAQVAEWRRGPAPHLELAANVSARVLTDEGLVARVSAALADHGLPPHALWLEVTETAVAADTEGATQALRRLRELGVRLALDDFGTGFSHLLQLRQFPVQAVKVDRCFIAGMSSNGSDGAIVRSVLNLGRDLGLTVIAEGVETDEQRAALVELRCDLAQGYLFGRPVPAADLVPALTPPAITQVPRPALMPGDAAEAARLGALRSCGVLDTAPEQAFDEVTALAAELCDAPIALVSLIDEHRQWFKSRVGVEAPETPREWAFCDHAIRNRAPLIVPDASTDERFADNPLVVGNPHIRSYAGMPLVLDDGSAVGTLCVIDQRPREFDRTQVQQLAVLADQVTALLELRRALRRLDDERSQLEQARAALHDRERYLQAILDSSPDIICRLTPEGIVEMASQSSQRLLGIDPADHVGRSAFDLIHPGDLAASIEALAVTAASLGQASATELRLRHADGHWVPMELVANTVEEHDGQRRIVLTGRDLSARRQAEQQLATSQAFIRAVLHGIEDGVVACGPNGAITYHNAAAETVASIAAADRLLTLALRSGEAVEDLRIPAPDGDRHVECRARRLVAPDGTCLGAVVTMRDVTDNRAAQAALRAYAYTDPLTGLANRRSFTEAIDRPGMRGVAYIDLDDFKAINDTYGHDIGDRVLEIVARRLQESCRAGADVVARLGGDEFGIVTSSDDVAGLARRLGAAVARPVEVAGVHLEIVASVGFARAGTGATRQDVVRRADHRMLAAKRARKAAARA